MSSPCLACGACCASYRVSFYWSEPESAHLDERLTAALSPFLACMAGTNHAAPRCAALQGTIGTAVRCAAYLDRPSPCRELQPGDDQCRRARRRHGLPELPGAPAPGNSDGSAGAYNRS